MFTCTLNTFVFVFQCLFFSVSARVAFSGSWFTAVSITTILSRHQMSSACRPRGRPLLYPRLCTLNWIGVKPWHLQKKRKFLVYYCQQMYKKVLSFEMSPILFWPDWIFQGRHHKMKPFPLKGCLWCVLLGARNLTVPHCAQHSQTNNDIHYTFLKNLFDDFFFLFFLCALHLFLAVLSVHQKRKTTCICTRNMEGSFHCVLS